MKCTGIDDYMQLNKRDGHIITEVCTQARFLKISERKWLLEISITWSDTYHNRSLYTSMFLKIDI